MIKFIKEIVLTLCVFVVSPVLGANNVSSNEASNSSGFDWNPVIQAIVQVESEGNTRAVSGNSCGAMQITPIFVM